MQTEAAHREYFCANPSSQRHSLSSGSMLHDVSFYYVCSKTKLTCVEKSHWDNTDVKNNNNNK